MDSGCPGSERSPSILTNVNVPMTRHLSHVEEEEPLNSHASSTLKHSEVIHPVVNATFHPNADFSSDEHLSLKKKRYYDRIHTSTTNVKHTEMRQLHSITDLSSDEQASSSYKQKVDNEIDRLKEQLELTPKKSNDSSHNSTLVIDLPNSTGKF